MLRVLFLSKFKNLAIPLPWLAGTLNLERTSLAEEKGAIFVKRRIACGGLLLLSLMALTACTFGGTLEDLSRKLSVDLSQGTIVTEEDSHGGFHGDGERWVEVSLEEDISSALEEAGWQELPLPETLEAALYSVTEVEGERTVTQGSCFQREIPWVSNGYYFFWDRHSESADPTDPTELMERSSFNFTVALYDQDSQTLYYGEVDT